ncbi:putative RNA-directed DNA polymerase from transposon BS [Amphibalanus amphitrite]|uniref:Putative RNA-directed DNA polymerase from transposon BS n=1 Tax=Amphibalanus amphitrite TaxID=1232801 RepID=A0A6A4WJL0_AMPAM|nr:putative RNA-directed DNA polymerase from transposon BS [Amphibalanus amphitrite]
MMARRSTWEVGQDLGSDHLPMKITIRASDARPQRKRKARWAHHKADWRAFQDDCEAALTGAVSTRTAQEAATRLTETIQNAAKRHIPKGARADPRPWALHPDLQEAIRDRQAARREIRPDDPDSRTRWIAAKQRAAEVEGRVSREQFHEFVGTTLNRPASLGRVSKILKSLTEQGLPLCLVRWVWQWLRDRRTRVEVRGDLSGERVFRAGLPQGSVLSPSLFVLWAAPLVEVIKKIPGCTPYMYADDTAVLCAGNTIEVARERAQRAADALTRWARESKMRVSGEKTQLLVLSQQAKDAKDCRIKVAGSTVEARETLHLLGVTLDRLLHFGPHCRRLRRKTRPRINQLRQLTGRSWGLGTWCT